MFKHKLAIGLFYFVFLSYLLFLAPLLIAKGMAATSVGFLNSLGLFILVLSFLGMGIITDIIKSNKQTIIISLSISIFAIILIFLVSNLVILSILYIVLFITFFSTSPIFDGLILKDAGEKNYTTIRAYGSLGASISFLVYSLFGVITNNLGLSTVVSYELYFLLNIFFVGIIIFLLTKIKEHSLQDNFNYRDSIKHIKTNKNLILIMIITFLSYGVISADDAYSVNYSFDFAHISIIAFGVVGFLSIFLEATLMIFYTKLEEKFGIKKILFFVCTLLAIIFYSKGHMYTSKFIFNFGNIILGVFTGLFIPLSVLLIERNTPDTVRNTTLALYQMANKLGGAILGLMTASYFAKTQFLPKIYDLHMIIAILAIFFIFGIKENYNSK